MPAPVPFVLIISDRDERDWIPKIRGQLEEAMIPARGESDGAAEAALEESTVILRLVSGETEQTASNGHFISPTHHLGAGCWSKEGPRPARPWLFLLILEDKDPAGYPAVMQWLESRFGRTPVWRWFKASGGRLAPRDVEEIRASVRDDRFRRAFVCSGHLIDQPDRPEPRFPASREPEVRAQIERQLDDWQAGLGDLAVSGAARGADILFAEACLRRGLHVRLLVAFEESEFIKQSVALASDGTWIARYHALKHAVSEVWFQPERLGPPPRELDSFSRCNLWILHNTLAEVPPDRLHAVLVWDEKPTGDGPGGTAHFADQIRRLGAKLSIINPTSLKPDTP